jgi:uncharacterized integral membrane protein
LALVTSTSARIECFLRSLSTDRWIERGQLEYYSTQCGKQKRKCLYFSSFRSAEDEEEGKKAKTDLSLPRYSRFCFSFSVRWDRATTDMYVTEFVLWSLFLLLLLNIFLVQNTHAEKKNFPYNQYKFTMRAICLAEKEEENRKTYLHLMIEKKEPQAN